MFKIILNRNLSPTSMKATVAAFTRIDLLASLLGTAVVAWMGGRLLAVSKPDSQRATCFNNLRQIGHAAEAWGDDHDDRFPWVTYVTDGGTRPPPGSLKAGAPWAEFLTLSNELSRPQLLACPSDITTKIASHFGNTANGLANASMRANAVSYFLSYHGEPERPRSVVAGDRDLRPSTPPPVSCSRGVNNAAPVFVQPPSLVVWTNLIHVGAGHLLFTDGAVEYVPSARLQQTLVGDEASDGASIHFVNTR